MDIITLIDKYVEISAKKQRLNKTIKDAEENEFYAKTEGDIAFYEKNYQLEQSYNKSVRLHREVKINAQRELSGVIQLLEITHQTYIQTVEAMNSIELKEAAIKISEKINNIKKTISQLTEERKHAIFNGDIAYNNKNYIEEKKYNDISRECYLEIERLTPLISLYDSFLSDLNNRANTPPHPKR